MQDALGQELHVGDRVARVWVPWKGHQRLAEGRVVEIKDKRVRVDTVIPEGYYTGAADRHELAYIPPHRVVRLHG